METNVHEICHSVTHYGIYDYLSHHQLNFNPGHLQYYFYLKPGTDFFIEMPDEFFPSAKLAVEIPVARRTFRFKTYITGTSSTQAHGLLGLLNEFNAYYHGFKTQWNLRPAYIEMFDDPVNGYVRWINRCSSLAEAYYEFRFFILEYLRMARVVYPKLYDRIRRNPTIATVFNSISNEFKVTVRLYQMEIDSGYRKFAAENNCTVSLEPKIGSVFFWRAGHSSASGFYQEMKNYEKVKDVLSSDRYSMVMKELGLQ
jgi:hypothetical protein